MIRLLKSGQYKLIETKHQTKILYLDRKVYAWINIAHIGEVLIVSRKPHKTDCILSIGQYRLYDVQDEPHLADHIHLELEVGENEWQGYLLLTGLPDSRKTRGRIIPTYETVASTSLLTGLGAPL